MHKESPWERKLKRVSVDVEWSREETIRASTMQIKGIVKYLYPTPALRKELEIHVGNLIGLGEFNRSEFNSWVEKTNPDWVEHIKYGKIGLKLNLRKAWRRVRKYFLKMI